MDIFALIAAFGGGVIGAYMGALPAFILTGFVAIVGSAVTMAGGADTTVGFIAFGSYLGPHIAFAGGVAASAYAGKAKKLSSGTDILTCLYGLGDPMTLIVGGVFGIIGFLIHYLIGSVLHLNTDLPGFTVIISAIIVRFMFGTSGLIGKAASGEKREYFTAGNGMLCNILLGVGIGTAAGFVYQALVNAGAAAVVIGSYPVLCFGIAAFTLMFGFCYAGDSSYRHYLSSGGSNVSQSGNGQFIWHPGGFVR